MRPFWKKAIGAGIAALILYFMVRSLTSSLREVGTYRLEISYPRLLFSFGLLGLLFIMYGIVWRYILRRLGYALTFADSMRIWFLSQAGRYVPGKVWFALGRIYLCERKGIPRAVAMIATALELGLVLASALIVFGVASIWVPAIGLISYPLGFAIVGIVLVASHPRFLKGFLRRFGKVSGEIQVRYRDTLRIMLIYVVCWIVYGLGFYLVATSFRIPTQTLDLRVVSQLEATVAMTGINSIAWAAGLVSVITPAGLGIREGISGILLSRLADKPYPVLIPLVARLWVTIGEVATIGIVLLQRGRR